MGRWTYKDEDSYRLPEGFTRIGYDADTRVYTYRDQGGRLYEGAPGASYGLLTPLPTPSRTSRNKRSQTAPLVSHDSHRFASPDTHWSNPAESRPRSQSLDLDLFADSLSSGDASPYSFNGFMDIPQEGEHESAEVVHWGTHKALPVPPSLKSPTIPSYKTHYISSPTPPAAAPPIAASCTTRHISPAPSATDSNGSSMGHFRRAVSRTVLPLNMRKIVDAILHTRSPTDGQATEQRPLAGTPVAESSALWLS